MPRRVAVVTDEPHAARRRTLMKEHPEIARLQGPEWRSKYICLALLVVPQLYLSTVVPSMRWSRLFPVWYGLGCTITQSLFLAIHELSHNLFFTLPKHNRLFSILVNLPIGIPFAVAFRTYHLRHHTSQGRLGVDGDLPTEWECRLLSRHWSLRLLWLSLQIVAYAVRPLLVTERPPLSRDLVANWVVQLLFNALWVHWFGWGSYVYLVSCVLGAGSLHPCAGHFVSEHYGFGTTTTNVDASPQETFSYYGPLNLLTWNVGYHNEHHDFPLVPWSRLPRLSTLLSERYRPLTACPSWFGCLLRFVTASTTYRVVRKAD